MADAELPLQGPLIVRFPRKLPDLDPVKLDHSQEDAASDHAQPPPPRNLIQVYLMGGYLVARWAWARFQERQNRRDSPGRDNRKD